MATGHVVLTMVTTLGCALMAGLFFGFSTLVMPALARLPTPRAIVGMQAVNAAAFRPAFLVVFVGTALACVLVVFVSLAGLGAPGAPLRLAGAAVYLLGSLLLTVVYHLPRNDALDGVDPGGPDARARWEAFVVGWTAWNHVRCAAALVATALLALSLG
jgi:uncharacterized membrane protein